MKPSFAWSTECARCSRDVEQTLPDTRCRQGSDIPLRGWVSPTRARWSRICSQVLFSLPNRCCGANRNEHQGQEQCSGSGLCEAARVCWPCALVTMIMAVEGMGTRREGVLLVTAGREDALFLSRARSAPGYIYRGCLGFVTVYLVP